MKKEEFLKLIRKIDTIWVNFYGHSMKLEHPT